MIHSSADVQTTEIGENTKIWQFSIVLAGARIGDNCNICSHCFIENEVIIGDNVTIKSGVCIWNGARIENNVFIGPNVTFTNDKTPRSKLYLKKIGSIVIKRGASIGANVTLLPDITIGDYSFIGAGSVQTRSTSRQSLWVGNPARFEGYVCLQGHRLDADGFCKDCDQKFDLKQLHNESL